MKNHINLEKNHTTYFITAIDTDAGKTIATGLLGQHLHQRHHSVITMKMAQTGCLEVSEDIQTHRQLMGIDWQDVDTQKLTCPYIFSYPASPHLSAAMENTVIDTARIDDALAQLQKHYETVLLEGVGGLMVPLTPDTLLIDWLKANPIPIILVTSGKLGSINHTLLSFSVLKQYGLSLYGVLYNHHPSNDKKIVENTSGLLKSYAQRYFPNSRWGEMTEGNIDNENIELLLKGNWF